MLSEGDSVLDKTGSSSHVTDMRRVQRYLNHLKKNTYADVMEEPSDTAEINDDFAIPMSNMPAAKGCFLHHKQRTIT